MLSQLLAIARSHARTPGRLLDNVRWRLPRTVSELEVLFVVGAPRSGTTLVQKLVEGHPAFFSIQGETGLFSMQNLFDTGRKHFGHSPQRQLELFNESVDVVDFFQNCVRSLPGHAEGRTFVEKTPQHVLKLDFLMRHFPRARFLYVARDGRDGYCSSLSHERVPQRGSVGRFARYWRDCARPPLARRQDPRVFTLRYEDLATDPNSHLAKAMVFAGAAFDPRQIDPAVYGNDHRAQRPVFRRLGERIEPTSVGRWRTQLKGADVATFHRVAGEELQALGYMA